MTEPLHLARPLHGIEAEASPPLRRRRVLVLGIVVWTAFSGLALWWLLRTHAGPSFWIIHEGDSLQPAAPERFHAWFKADMGLQRVYPWILFGPYVALLALYWPLERGRLRLSLSLNLAACVAFVAASQAINARTSMTVAKVTIIKGKAGTNSVFGSYETNAVRAEIFRMDSKNPLSEEIAENQGRQKSVHHELQGIFIQKGAEFSDVGLTNHFNQKHLSFIPPMPPPGLPKPGLWPMLMDLLAYGTILGVVHSVHFYRRFREREHRALVLESNLANARLNALRGQLQPHFLFNSLNSIVTLLRRDPRLAESTLLSLSDLLRLALSQSERQEVALREEMQFVQRYLEIQQTRFGDRLRVEQSIEPAALDGLVPTLLLQPLVENAIRHGIEPAENNGLVRVTARRQDKTLIVTVEDDGVGLATSNNWTASERLCNGTGIGLANLKARLQTLYGSDQKLELVPRSEGGVAVLIRIPWRSAGSLETAGGGSHL
jgi:two-component sensor histidine kinase